MAITADTVQSLIDQLAKDHEAFVERSSKTHELLQQTLVALRQLSQPVPNASHQTQQRSTSSPTPITYRRRRRDSVNAGIALTQAFQRTTTADIEVASIPDDQANSVFTGDSDSESDDDFVRAPLAKENYDLKGLREHIKKYPWTDGGRNIICGLDEDEEELNKESFLPFTRFEAEADRSHVSHYSIYDVGFDGIPLNIKHSKEESPTRAMQIWNRIRSANTHPKKDETAGRIIIVREPSPKLFAALHYTMNKHFDMDEIFDLLRHESPGRMLPHRAFDHDERKKRSFIITMEYFTIIGEQCKPMTWQSADDEEERKLHNHIPISRCGSVIALSLEGPAYHHVKNLDRRIPDKRGDVFDPFSPWRVLSIHAYPDWRATVDTHKSTNHYVNGPEAFLYTVQAEFADAYKRLKEVYNEVTKLVEPPRNFIFREKVRDALLFEDDQFTYSKKYFWAYQTLSKINQDLTEMIESYRDTFRDCVWDGTNKIIWPGESGISNRYLHFRRRMAKLKNALDDEVEKLEYIKSLNSKKMRDIEVLRENLFSGTQVMESRRSVEQAQVTVEQNRSVLLLTLVTIFFLPLTFVTSVFGMTNMDPSESYIHFGWTLIAICIPTYLLIGSMHTDAGLKFWTHNKNAFFAKLGSWLAAFLALFGYVPEWAKTYRTRTQQRQYQEEEDPPPYSIRSKRGSVTGGRRSLDMRLQSNVSESSLPLTQVTSRERQIPRPQLTSGDARDSVDLAIPPKARTRSNSIKFSVNRSARVRSVGSAVNINTDDDGSVSPRSGSPRRTANEAWEGEKRRVSFVGSNSGSMRGFMDRWLRRREASDRDGREVHRRENV